MRKGISLVALVITIIVLIILTAAVFLTGGNVPANAELAVFYNDVSNVQDAVTLKMTNNLADKYDDSVTPAVTTEFEGIVANASTTIGAATPTGGTSTTVYPATAGGTGVSVDLWAISATPADLGLSITAAELAKYSIDANGGVYYYNAGQGKTIDGKAYFRNGGLVSQVPANP